MPVPLWYSNLRTGLVFEFKFDHYRRLVAHHPAVVAGFDGDHLRGDEILRAAVLKGHVDSAARQESDMRGTQKHLCVRKTEPNALPSHPIA